MTEHLWMVTKGRLPAGTARGGQRYGRPKHAGVTRQRVNTVIVQALRDGWIPQHWVKPYPSNTADVRATVLRDENELITAWNLRTIGWNRQ
jgi:hypothetical protein